MVHFSNFWEIQFTDTLSHKGSQVTLSHKRSQLPSLSFFDLNGTRWCAPGSVREVGCVRCKYAPGP